MKKYRPEKQADSMRVAVRVEKGSRVAGGAVIGFFNVEELYRSVHVLSGFCYR